MLYKFYCILFLFFIQTQLKAQDYADSLSLQINLGFKNKSIVLGEKYISKQQDTLSLDVIKFYISSVEIKYNDNKLFKEKNSFHLIDISKPESLNIKLEKLEKKEIKALKFNIGIDSLTSISGAFSGDLDLQNGMYWAWQSGYINMKIEGKSKSCKTRKNEFQFHIGGYLEPNYSMRTVEINCNNKTNGNINLALDLSLLFDNIDLKETNSIMIPGKKAMEIADLSTKMFSIE